MRGSVRSRPRLRVLIQNRVDVVPKPPRIDRGRAGDGCRDRSAPDELTPDRAELTNRNAAPSNDEFLAAVESAHDLAAVVPKVTLTDDGAHEASVAHMLRAAFPAAGRRAWRQRHVGRAPGHTFTRFSEVVDDALQFGPQTVTRRGEPVVVVVAIETWRRMAEPAPSLKDYLRAAPLDGLDLSREDAERSDVALP